MSLVNAKVLFYNSFDNGFDADYSEGSSAAIYHDDLELSAGKDGKGLWCKPNEYIRFETDGNIDFTEGTIDFWIKPNYSPVDYRENFGPAVQCVFSMRIRTGDMIELRLRNDKDKPVMWLMTGNAGKKQRSNINIEFEGWDSIQWHNIKVAWKQPGSLALKVDDQQKVIENAVIPSLPASMIYDIYFGTNSNQTSLFRMEHFDGVIDDVYITDTWQLDADNYPIPEEKKADCVKNLPRPKRIGKNGQHKDFYVKPDNSEWSEVPVKYSVDLGEKWLKLSSDQKRAAVNGFRLVKYSPQTGEGIVYDSSLRGEQKFFIPFTVSDDVYYKQTTDLRFTHKGSEAAVYRFSFDYSPKYSKPFPVNIPLVGNGDMLRVGDKTTIGTLCSGISGVFDVCDIDGDGDLDLWMNSGTLKTRACTNLQVGHFFFENISRQSGVENVFAPGKLIIRDNTKYGYISGVVVPDICDINNDGKDDILVLGRTNQEWWQWHFENGNVVIDKINKIEFTGEPLKKEYKTGWFDWDGDGLGDVVASGLLDLKDEELIPVMNIYRNVGNSEKPLIDTENPITLDIGLPQLQWQYVLTDWDGDGDVDFVSAGFIHELYLHINKGDNAFEEPQRLKTFDRREINIKQALVNIVVCDWDNDGDNDLLYGCEDGVVGFMENIAGSGDLPQLRQPVFLQQIRPVVDGGTISIPVVTDWDNDGDKDLLIAASNTMQYYENAGSDEKPLWLWPENMKAGDSLIELRAGDDGSVQGLEELCWQYNNAEVEDWDGDGLKDLIVTGIRGEHVFFKNIGSASHPRLAAGQLIKVDWQGEAVYPEWLTFKPQPDSLVTAWRTKPEILDWNKDGLMDYITLDSNGILALYLRGKGADGNLVLNPPQNIFEIETPYSQALVWNRAPDAKAGRAGRTIVNLIDWDRDGDYDLIYDNVNARYYENTTGDDAPLFKDRGDLVKERVANHNAGPYPVDFDNDLCPDLFIGSETGRVFYFSRAYIEDGNPEIITDCFND
ncbi:MAG: FG-GAP-like repeat-containing protein [Sedimentisphaeraceae bacterium JB056]